MFVNTFLLLLLNLIELSNMKSYVWEIPNKSQKCFWMAFEWVFKSNKIELSNLIEWIWILKCATGTNNPFRFSKREEFFVSQTENSTTDNVRDSKNVPEDINQHKKRLKMLINFPIFFTSSCLLSVPNFFIPSVTFSPYFKSTFYNV